MVGEAGTTEMPIRRRRVPDKCAPDLPVTRERWFSVVGGGTVAFQAAKKH